MKKNKLFIIPSLLFIIGIFVLLSFIPNNKKRESFYINDVFKLTKLDSINKKEQIINLKISKIEVTQSEIIAKL